jgi:hypothetical protein
MTHRITIEYEVTTSFQLTVERDEIPKDHALLLESVTRDELASPWIAVAEIEWGHIKEAWRSATPDNTWAYDENNDPIYPCPEHF